MLFYIEFFYYAVIQKSLHKGKDTYDHGPRLFFLIAFLNSSTLLVFAYSVFRKFFGEIAFEFELAFGAGLLLSTLITYLLKRREEAIFLKFKGEDLSDSWWWIAIYLAFSTAFFLIALLRFL
ncbi:hypothetical protein [Rufibacter sp. LB8]|uniref:hypothetical protein n=1 Tax=Rufibacter sp. LB8 TaxID=2777781 RepID=UPI00178C23E6|nr:hypothetical protein [Rufibacter sp. LB8]